MSGAPKLGHLFPNFEADTTHGRIKFHDYIGDRCVSLLGCGVPNCCTLC